MLFSNYEGTKMTRKEFNLRRERERRGLTQKDVYEGIPMPKNTYCRHEQTNKFKELDKRGYIHFFEEITK